MPSNAQDSTIKQFISSLHLSFICASSTDKKLIIILSTLTPFAGFFCVSCSAEALDIWPDEHSSWIRVVSEALVGLDVLGARGVSTFSTLSVCATETTAGGEAGRGICLLVKTPGSPHWREEDTWGGFMGAFFLDWSWGSLEIPVGKWKTTGD